MSYRVLIGDCIKQMRTLPDCSVHCCVTSTPYFGLRDYGHADQIGLEATPDAFVAKLVEVFREVRRVLRDDGTVWLNLGDSYASSTKGSGGKNGNLNTPSGNNEPAYFSHPRKFNHDVKDKDLLGIPWRVAFALQADGWYLRQDIIWHKPNPMPESVRDRCTKAHEYIFLLTKSARYWYDNTAIAEESIYKAGEGGHQRFGAPGGKAEKEYGQQVSGKIWNSSGSRNKRSVWTVATRPYAGAHFATFPPDLIRPCILAGCPTGGTVLDPFGGSGTTAEVSVQEGRNAILCELNTEYVPLIHNRLSGLQIKIYDHAENLRD